MYQNPFHLLLRSHNLSYKRKKGQVYRLNNSVTFSSFQYTFLVSFIIQKLRNPSCPGARQLLALCPFAEGFYYLKKKDFEDICSIYINISTIFII